MKDHSKIKRARIIYVIFMAAAFVFFSLWLIHSRAIADENPGIGFLGAAKEGLKELVRRPLAILPLPESVKSILKTTTFAFAAFGVLGFLAIGLRGSEKPATAKWLTDLKAFNKRFNEPFGSASNDGPNNIPISQELCMSQNNKVTRYNTNQLVTGGSGAGKSYMKVGPDIMQVNASYVVTDPSGGLYKRFGKFLQDRGYRVCCLNLARMDKSDHYNPFNYIHSNKDIQILVSTLIANTTPPDVKGGDPFWEKAERLLLVSIIAYIYNHGKKESHNFGTVMRMLLDARADENDSTYQSKLDVIFKALETEDPESFALKQYKMFKSGTGKTMQSIIISCQARLEKFALQEVVDLTSSDDMGLDYVGDEKTAIFVILQTGEGTFDFIASMLYSQLFLRVYDYCEYETQYGTRLYDADGIIVKTFRARNKDEEPIAKAEAEAVMARIDSAKIVENARCGWFEIRDCKTNEMIAFRGTEKAAREQLEKIKKGELRPGNEQLPMPTRLILDEFANIGRIPDFEKKVATIRKYSLSVEIILQSLSQLQNLYPKNWSEITGNCDTTIYLGGGADEVTTKWLATQIGKATKRIRNESYAAGGHSGSTSYNTQAIDLYAIDEMRRMEEDQCIVIIRGLQAYKGKKIDPTKHKNYKDVENYGERYERSQDIANALRHPDIYQVTEKEKAEKEAITAVKEQILEKTESVKKEIEKENDERQYRAEEYRQNRSKSGRPIFGEPEPVTDENPEIKETLGIQSEADVERVANEILELNGFGNKNMSIELDYSTIKAEAIANQ